MGFANLMTVSCRTKIQLHKTQTNMQIYNAQLRLQQSSLWYPCANFKGNYARNYCPNEISKTQHSEKGVPFQSQQDQLNIVFHLIFYCFPHSLVLCVRGICYDFLSCVHSYLEKKDNY